MFSRLKAAANLSLKDLAEACASLLLGISVLVCSALARASSTSTSTLSSEASEASDVSDVRRFSTSASILA
jgi:hypothetical protein